MKQILRRGFVVALLAAFICFTGCFNNINGNGNTNEKKTTEETLNAETAEKVLGSGWQDKDSIEIPSGVKTIRANVFAGGKYSNNSKLVKVTIPSTVTEIQKGAFAYCTALTTVTFKDGIALTVIDDNMFYNCEALKNITIPNGVTEIGKQAFSGCASMQTATMPDSVKTIGTEAFYNCSLLKSIVIPNSVTEIEASTFQNCSSLESITIPNGVTTIGDYAFNNCNKYLEKVAIPNSVKTIGKGVFQGCKYLETVTIGTGVTIIDNAAFSYCENLKSFTIKATTPPKLGEGVIRAGYFGSSSIPSGLTIYVPTSSVDDYKREWDTYKNYIQGTY